MVNCGGLRSSCKDQVPLRGIEVEVEVRDHVATVSSVLQYENQEESPIEADFVFPLPGDAAVCHFSAKIGQSEVVAVVKEKQRARDEYNHVLSSGQQAFLLEESEQSPDVFSLSLGSLPPGESACIRLQYVTELALEADGGLRFCLPAVLNPRYQPQGRWEGHRPLVVTSVSAFLVPYSLSLSARLSSPRPVTKVESNCSLEPLRYLNTEQTNATVRLAAGHRFDRDVELLIYYKDAHRPTAVVEAGQESVEAGSLMGDPVVMLSLYPEFPKAVTSPVTTCGEFLFLMDRSGSMHDHTRIESARDTLMLILKSLPMGCYFNIYGFGTHFNHIFPESVEYNRNTMEEALKKVEMMKADMGGTEILRPLRHIYEQSCIPGHPRQLFVFTDGEVQNTKDVIGLVKKNSGSHRCFTFGIGEGASSALINGMSKQGGGHAQFITGTERMQPKVMQSLRFALQPVVVDISLEWNLPVGVSVTPLSPPTTSLFQGQRSLIYAQLTGESSSASDGSVKVRYRLADQPFECQLHFSLKPAKGETELTVHRLGARTLIRSLEQIGERGQVDEVKKKVVELSIESGVSSAFTAFIAVNRGNWEMVQAPLLRRNVPVPGSRCGFSFGASQSELNGPSGPFTLGSKTPGQPETPFQPAGSTLFGLGAPSGGFSFSFGSTSFGGKPLGHCGHPSGSVLFSLNKPKSPFWGGGQTGGSVFAGQPGGSLFGGQPGAAQNMELDMGMEIDRPSGNMTIGSSEEGRGGFEKAHSYPSPRVKLLWLIGLQRYCGSWRETPALEDVLDKSEYQIENSRPAQVDEEVWTTVVALIWLYGTKFEAQEEWQPSATKAIAWLHAQNGSKPLECFAAGLDFLELRRLKDAKGLRQLAIRLCV